jgi:hypothetical protein
MSEANEPPASMPRPIDSASELELDRQKKKRRTMVVLFVVLPVIVALGIGVSMVVGGKTASREIGEAFDRASACVVGKPLAEGERASLRVRAIQLVSSSAERDAPEEQRWPRRCADAVAELNQALRRHDRDEGGEQGLAGRSETLAVALRKSKPLDDLSLQVDGFYDAAKAFGLSASEVGITQPTPEPARVPNLDSMPADSQLTPLQYTLDRVTSTPMVGPSIHALVHDARVDPAPLYCVFGETTNRCMTIKGIDGKAGVLLGGTADADAAPLVFVGQEGENGIHRIDGEKVAALRAEHSYVSSKGYVAIAGGARDDKGSFDIIEQSAPKAEIETHGIEPGDVGDGIERIVDKAILWDQLLLLAANPKEGAEEPFVLFARPLPLEAGKFGRVGTVAGTEAVLSGCRSSDTFVVRVGAQRGSLTFLVDGKWSSPRPLDQPMPVFTCDKGEAVFTGGASDQVRCTPAGCQPSRAVAPEVAPFKVTDSYWADLYGKVLTVAVTDSGGVRFAHGETLLKPVFDDRVRDGAVVKESTVLGALLGARARFAVLLMTTPKGVYALRFEKDGQAAPARLTK